MGYQGSSNHKIEEITGIPQLQVLTHRIRVRWAASISGETNQSSDQLHQRILSEELGEEVVLTFMRGEERGGEVR